MLRAVSLQAAGNPALDCGAITGWLNGANLHVNEKPLLHVLHGGSTETSDTTIDTASEKLHQGLSVFYKTPVSWSHGAAEV